MRFPTLVRGSAERPIIAVAIEAEHGRRTNADMLVDPGSDLTLLPEHLASTLGIDLSGVAAAPVSSALGSMASYRCYPLLLELRRLPDVLRWRTMVGFVPRPMAYGILGTRGFFQFFNLRYHASEHWLEIVPAGPLPL